VYRDNNDDGTREPGEAGISGVDIQIVSITTIASPISLTTKTLSDGSYSFIGLPPGRYRISETSQPIDFFDGKDSPGTVRGQTRGSNTTNDQITEIRLDGNDTGIEFNFGEIEPASLSGHVCVAMPGFDCFSTEPNSIAPLPGVKIDLVNASGTVVATTFTVADGSYRFDRLPAGVYSIVETQPADLLDGLSRAGVINGLAVGNASSGTRIEQVAIGGGQQGVNYDFCELPPASLSGRVYQDDNNDGIRQNSEPRIPGATIRLFDSTGGLLGEIATDSQGYYAFTGLRKGTYRIAEITPVGYLDGKDSVGRIANQTVGQLDGTDAIKSIQLPSGLNGENYDFGEILPASISGNVYEDVDGDCIRDPGELSIGAVVIDLLDANGNVVSTTQTDVAGNYRFDDLLPGVYTLRESQPPGYIQGGQMAGSVGGNATLTDIISAIALGAGVHATNYDSKSHPSKELCLPI
jgi:serine-aspartate repeat-containing protein C/D/E